MANRYSNDIPTKNLSRIFIASGKENGTRPLTLSLAVLSVFSITVRMSFTETLYRAISASRLLYTVSPPSTVHGGFWL